MTPIERLARYMRRNTTSQKNTKITKSNRSVAPMLIAAVAVLAAVAFSVTVGARRGGWLRQAQPSAPAPSSNPEVAKNSTTNAAVKRLMEPPTPAVPFAPTVTATKADSLIVDNDVDGKADPGDTLRYTVVIGATGEDATGVTFTDTVDPNTTFANALQTTPLARPDSYAAAGNVRIQVAAPGVLANDQDFDGVGPALNVTAGTFLSAQGGNVTINTDGSFSYNPKPGYESAPGVPDTFTYTLNDGEGPGDTGTVSITVTGMIWFINNNFGGTSDGRLTNPFKTLAEFQAINDGGNSGLNPSANDNIFVYESSTAYSGSVILLAGQKFIGQDATDTLSNISGVNPPAPHSDALPGTSPGGTLVTITSGGTALTLGTNNTVRGFTFGNAVSDIDGSGFGTLNITDVTLNGTGRALSLTNGTLRQVNGTGSATFASISSASSATTGISLSSVAGGFTSGSTTVSGSTGIGISVGSSSATLGFANTSVSTSSSTGVSLLTNTGPISFGSLTISPSANQRGLLATDNSGTITATSGTITTSGAAGTNAEAVRITHGSGTTMLAISLTTVNANGGNGGIVLSNTAGSFTVTGNSAGLCGGQVSGSPLSITTAPNTADCTGGRIQLMTGADGAAAGIGISLTSAQNVSLTRMRLDNHSNFAIKGSSVTALTLNNILIDGVNGSTNSPDEGSINITNLLGTSSMTNSTVRGGFEDNINILNNTGTGTFTITGSTIRDNSTTTGNDGVFGQADPGANFTLKVINSVLQRHRGDHINTTQSGNGVINTVVTGNTMTFNGTIGQPFDPTTTAGGSVTLTTGANFTGTSTFNVSNNNITGAKTAPININNTSLSSTLTGIFSGTINANTIGLAGAADSGSDGDGIDVTANGNANITVTITNNNVRQYELIGINLVPRDGAATMNATVTGNTVGEPFDGTQAAQAILFNGGPATTETGNSCVNIGGAGALINTFPNYPIASGSSALRVRQRAVNTVFLPGYVGGAFDTAAVAAFVSGRNGGAGTTATANNVPGAGGFQNTAGGAPCTAGAAPTGPVIESSSEVTALQMTSNENNASKVSSDSQQEKVEKILWATSGENANPRNVVTLSQSEVSAMAQAAIARLAESGLSAKKVAQLQALSFEIADLPAGQLATATDSKITLDTTAAGYGWFFDATPSDDSDFEVSVPNRELQATEVSAAHGRIDLLTVLLRQLSATVNPNKSTLQSPQSWLMENTLEPGTRRAPAFKTEVAKVSAPKAGNAIAAKSNDAKQPTSNTSYEQVASAKRPRNSRVLRNHAMRAAAPTSFVDVNLNIGVLPAGKSITITFNVTVNNPYQGATNIVSNQGTVSGTNFANVLTDDPDVNVLFPDPTKTTIDQPDVTVAVSPASVLEDGSDNLVYTFTREGSTAAALTVNFSVGGTAVFNNDYTQTGAASFNATSGTVTIPIGSSTATVTLDPTSDLTVEGNETAILTVISGASYDVGVPASATGTITNDDTDVTVAVAPSSVEEDGAGNLVYTFTRNGVTNAPLTVSFSVGGTATFNDDYTQTGAATFTTTDGTVTFATGNTTATVTVDPTADNIVESSETVTLTLTAGTGYNVANPSTATGTINNDDAEVTVAVAPSSVDEDGATNLTYTFTRTGDTTGPLTVNFSVGGTATFSSDYTQTGAATFTTTTGTATFADGASTKTVTVDPSADVTAEPDETVILTLTAGTGYNIGTPGAATGTINNDDTTVSVAVSPLSTNEDGATNLVYTFTRSDSSGALPINFSVGGTATFNTDYTQTGAATFTASTGTVTFADGSLTTTVTVDPTTDISVEPDETVILTVTAGAGYAVGAPASATGTITNDDTDVSVAVAPLSTTEDGAGNLVYTFTRNGVTTGALTVNFSVGGTATFNTDYTQTGAATFTTTDGSVTFAAGSSTATVTVDPTADNSVEPDETVILTVTVGTGYNIGAPSAATGTITNDDSSVSIAVAPSTVDEDGAANLVYTFTRTGSTTGALTVNFSVGGTATFNTDYTQTGAATFTATDGTVTFGAGNTTAMVTVDPSADVTTEPDETVILTVVGGTGYEVGAPAAATGTINNDDNAVSVAVSPLSTSEDGATNLVYTFTRGDSSGAQTINFSVGGTATFNTDYTQTGAATFTASTGTVTFADGSLTATVTVDPSSDLAVEPDETVILTVTAGSGYTVGAPASATGTITNDDTDVSVAVSPLSVAEDGAGNLVYTFSRSGVTTGPLTVNFSVGGTATFNTDYTQTGAATFTASTGTVTFAAGSSTATVTVDPTADGAAELDETVILTVTGGTGYNVAAPSSATGTIVNDDTEVSVTVSPSSVLEDGATNMVYTFTRVGIISNALTVNFQASGTAVFAPPGGDYFATGADTFVNAGPGTVTFLAGSSTATVTVDPLGDADLEPNETVILTVTAGAGYTVGTPNSATGTILNDDNSPPTIQVGYGQCNAETTGTVNLLVGDVETPANSLTLSATSSNTAVVALADITFGGSGANRTLKVKAKMQSGIAFSDLTISVFDGTFTSSINVRVIVGTNKTEVINIGTSTVGTDMIFGGNGDDTINSGAGNDLICGGNGGGTINAGLGNDTVDGGNGNDTLIGGDGDDRLLGGNGNDTMTGGTGADFFDGGGGTDTVTDFNPGQGDTKTAVEFSLLFGPTDWNERGVFAYLAPPPRYWVSPWGTLHY